MTHQQQARQARRRKIMDVSLLLAAALAAFTSVYVLNDSSPAAAIGYGVLQCEPLIALIIIALRHR